MKTLVSPKDFPSVTYPRNSIARIYNQFPRRYPGGLPEMIKDLPRIAAMGFNVIWMNPIQLPTQFEASPTYKGSLYAMADDLLFNDAFFPDIPDHQERVKLVQEYTCTARALGIMPIFDLVLNHVGKRTPLEKKFLAQGLLNTEPKNNWKDATFFDYADEEERDEKRIIIPNLENQQKIIEQLWEPFVKRYIGTYGFTGVRADAVINVEPGLQASVYAIIKKYCQAYHQVNSIILGEFMAEKAYKHIDNLRGRGFTHIFAPATPYSRLLEYKEFPSNSYYYNNDHDKNDIDGVIEQTQKLQAVAAVAGILGNHDLAMLKAIVLLRKLEVPNEQVHALFEKVESFLNSKGEAYINADQTCDPQLREWILLISTICAGGYYSLAGDEYGVLKKPSVFDNHKEEASVEKKWGGNKDLSSYFKCVNYLLSQLPEVAQGDRIAYEKRMIDGVALHVIWRRSAKNGQEYVICTSDSLLSPDRILAQLNVIDKNIYFVQNHDEHNSQLLHYNPEQPHAGLQPIDLNQLSPLQILHQAIAQYHIGNAMKIAGNKEQAKESFEYAALLLNQAEKLDSYNLEIIYYSGLIDLKLNEKKQATEKFSKVIKLAENVDLLNAAIEVLLELGETELAMSGCGKALGLNRAVLNPVTALIYAKTLLKLDNLIEAREWFSKAFSSTNWETTCNIAFLNESGELAKALGLNKEALHCFKQAAEFDFDNPEAWIKLARFYDEFKNPAEEQQALYNAGIIYMALRQDEKAYEAFAKAINLESKNIELYNQLGEQLQLIADHNAERARFELLNSDEEQAQKFNENARLAIETAKVAFTKTKQLQPDDFAANFHLGHIAVAAGRKEEAKQFLEIAFQSIPKNISIIELEQLGQLLSQAGLEEKKQVCYQQIFNYYALLAKEKSNFFYPFYKMGNAALVVNEIGSPREYLLKAFELTKEKVRDKITKELKETGRMLTLNNQLHYVQLADDLVKVGCFNEALVCYKEVATLLANDDQFNLKLGDLYLKSSEDNYKKASTHFTTALRLYQKLPESMQAPDFLALLHVKLGDAQVIWGGKEGKPGILEKALKSYETAKELLNYNDEELEAKINNLKVKLESNGKKTQKEVPATEITTIKSEDPDSMEDYGLGMGMGIFGQTIEAQVELFQQEEQELIREFSSLKGILKHNKLVLTIQEEAEISPDFFDKLREALDRVALNLELPIKCAIEKNKLIVLYGEVHALMQMEEFLKATGLTIDNAVAAETIDITDFEHEPKFQKEARHNTDIWHMRESLRGNYSLIKDIQSCVSDEDFVRCEKIIVSEKSAISKLYGEDFSELLDTFIKLKPGHNYEQREKIQNIINTLIETRTKIFISTYSDMLEGYLTEQGWKVPHYLQVNNILCLSKLIQAVKERSIENVLDIMQKANFKEEMVSLSKPEYDAVIITLVNSFREEKDHGLVQKSIDTLINNRTELFDLNNDKKIIGYLEEHRYAFNLQPSSKSNQHELIMQFK